MVNSPQNCQSSGSGIKRRPATPHYNHSNPLMIHEMESRELSAFGFDFPSDANMNDGPTSIQSDGVFGTTNNATRTLPAVCSIPGGMSLATAISTVLTSQPNSPTSSNDNGDNILHRLSRIRSFVKRSLTNCAANIDGVETYNVQYEYDDYYEFERDKSLMARAASWGTMETENADSQSSTKENHVQFHYPPITSVRLRPRTESDEINQLFFAAEELDEIEDDRLCTRATDDVETLAVGDVQDSTCTSSNASTFDFDENESDSPRCGRMTAGSGYSNVMLDQDIKHGRSPRTAPSSPRKKERRESSSSGSGKRLIRGVQIMLREKSTRDDSKRYT